MNPPSEYFADAAMRDPELAGDITRPDPLVGQFHDPLPDHVGQGTAIDEHPSQLIHAAMTWWKKKVRYFNSKYYTFKLHRIFRRNFGRFCTLKSTSHIHISKHIVFMMWKKRMLHMRHIIHGHFESCLFQCPILFFGINRSQGFSKKA